MYYSANSLERNRSSSNSSIFFTANCKTLAPVIDSGRVCAKFRRIDRGTYNTEGSREDRRRFNQPCVHEGITICWRARVVWRRRDQRDGREGNREPVWVINANFFRGLPDYGGGSEKKGERKNGASRGARRRRAFIVTRIHQSLARRERVSNGTSGLLIARVPRLETGMKKSLIINKI